MSPEMLQAAISDSSGDWQDMKIVENRRQPSFNVFCFESPAFGSGFCLEKSVLFFLIG
jgi:hypothetical protein